jgi:hypothetical protein
MLSRRRSQVFSRKGSTDRSSESKFGASGKDVVRGSVRMAAKLVGNLSSSSGASEGSWWRSEVRRCELWMVRGSSTRMSWYFRPLFWRLWRVSILSQSLFDGQHTSLL